MAEGKVRSVLPFACPAGKIIIAISRGILYKMQFNTHPP